MAYRNKANNNLDFFSKKSHKDHKIKKNPHYVCYIRNISLKFEIAFTVSI